MIKYLISYILLFNLAISQNHLKFWEPLNYLNKNKNEITDNMNNSYNQYFYHDSLLLYNIDNTLYISFKFDKNNTCTMYSISYTVLNRIEDYKFMQNSFKKHKGFKKEKEIKEFNNMVTYYSLKNSNLKICLLLNRNSLSFLFYR